MVVMRVAIGLLLFSLSGRSLVTADEGELRKLEGAKRIFELRRALDQTTGDEQDTRYYRALIEARFGQEEAAIDHFREFLAAKPDERMRRKSHEELANALIWLGRYGDAAAELGQVLQLMARGDSERGPTRTLRAVCNGLKDVSPQTVEFRTGGPLTAKFNKLGFWSLPVEANGRKAEWVVDTGMTFSTVTESEAKRVGLELSDSGGRGGSDHTGKEVPFRLAIAPELRIGAAHLRNVVFAVVADGALKFGPLGSQRLHGIVGLPAIRALGSIAVSARGVVRIHSDSPKIHQSDPNIFFDGLTAIVAVRHAGRTVPMYLDTGGDTTYLYSSFRETLTPEERAKLMRQRRGFTGVGGSVKVETELVPQLELELPGRTVGLRKVSLRLDSPPPGNGYSDGLLGMDALKGGFTVDFRTMRFEMD
jgi:hypothetical protein